MSTKGRLKRTLRRHARRKFRKGSAYCVLGTWFYRRRKRMNMQDRYIVLIDTYAYNREQIAVMRYRNACTTQWSKLWRHKR
jgi:hypothetical protein